MISWCGTNQKTSALGRSVVTVNTAERHELIFDNCFDRERKNDFVLTKKRLEKSRGEFFFRTQKIANRLHHSFDFGYKSSSQRWLRIYTHTHLILHIHQRPARCLQIWRTLYVRGWPKILHIGTSADQVQCNLNALEDWVTRNKWKGTKANVLSAQWSSTTIKSSTNSNEKYKTAGAAWKQRILKQMWNDNVCTLQICFDCQHCRKTWTNFL